MKAKEITQKSKEELLQLAVESREKLRELRFKVANKQLKNVREIRAAKKTIARALTQLQQLKKEEKINNKSASQR